MHVVKDSLHLFDRFTARAIMITETLNNARAIVQNSGVELTDKDIDQWVIDATKQINTQHQKQLQLITDTVAALKAM